MYIAKNVPCQKKPVFRISYQVRHNMAWSHVHNKDSILLWITWIRNDSYWGAALWSLVLKYNFFILYLKCRHCCTCA